MKKVIALFFFFFDLCFINAQSLSIAELQTAASATDWSEVNKMLIAKGWDFYDSEKGSENGYGKVTWTYEKNKYDDKAVAWFYFYQGEGRSKIAVQLSNLSAYEKIQSHLDDYGYKLEKSDIDDSIVTIYYANSEYNISLKSKKGKKDGYESSQSVYFVNVSKKITGLVKNYYPNGALQGECHLNNGVMNGIFKSYYENGNIKIESNYVNDLLDGPFSFYMDSIYSEKDYVKGKYRKGKLDGSWIHVVDLDTCLYKKYKFYKNGLPVGSWKSVFIYKDGTERVASYVTYKNGKKEGKSIEVMGDSIAFCNYRNGELDGSYKLYIDTYCSWYGGLSESDTTKSFVYLEEVGQYRKGKKDGVWLEDMTPKIRTYTYTKGIYINGVKEGDWVKYQNDTAQTYYGEEIERVNYVNGLRDGLSSTRLELKYDSIGRRLVYDGCTKTIMYRVGKRYGKFLYKDRDGRVIEEGDYLNGKKVGLWKKVVSNNSGLDVFYENDEEKYIIGYQKDIPRIRLDFSMGDGGKSATLTLYHENGKKWMKGDWIESEGKGEMFDFLQQLRFDAVLLGGDLSFMWYYIPFNMVEDGYFEYFTSNGDFEAEEFYSKGKSMGVWTYYDYTNKVYYTVNTEDMNKEFYYSLDSKKPYTGEVVNKSDEIEILYVKKGLVKKAVYKNLDGVVLKELTYRKGLLKE
ncbi:MAG: hypothetical protein J6Y37_15565 [Paludibacteraceae bacterium]|nr:hypothetical protein [Paludibacteraceae bacterium]